MSVTKDQIGGVTKGLAASFHADLLALSSDEIAAEWYWRWEEDRSIDWTDRM